MKPHPDSQVIGIIGLDTLRGLYQKVGGLDDPALIRKDVRLRVGKLLERRSHVDSVIVLKEPLVCLLKVWSLNQFVWISIVISCPEKSW